MKALSINLKAEIEKGWSGATSSRSVKDIIGSKGIPSNFNLCVSAPLRDN